MPALETVKFEPPRLGDWLDQAAQNKKRWIVDRLIPEKGITLLSGQQKRARKTWTSDLIALCVASGKVDLGRFITPCSTHPVLYVQEEGQALQTRDRILSLANTLQLREHIAELPIHFAFQNFVRVNKEYWQKAIHKHLDKVPTDLVIFDGLTFIHDVDENSKQEMATVVDALRKIRNRGTAVLLLCHLNDSKGENEKADIDTQIRGSTIVANAYDSHIALRKYDGTLGPIKVKVRHRGAEGFEGSITWHVENDEEGIAQHAWLDWAEGEELPFEIDTLVSVLMPDQLYDKATLRKLWGGMTAKKCNDAIKMLEGEGILHAHSKGRYRL